MKKQADLNKKGAIDELVFNESDKYQQEEDRLAELEQQHMYSYDVDGNQSQNGQGSMFSM